MLVSLFKMNSFNNLTALNVSSNKTSSNCDPNLPFVETIIFCCFHAISGFSSFTGNLLVLLSIYQTPSLRTMHNIFIASMASADFLVGLAICPLYIAFTVLDRVWATVPVLYKMENFLWVQTLVAYDVQSLRCLSGSLLRCDVSDPLQCCRHSFKM